MELSEKWKIIAGLPLTEEESKSKSCQANSVKDLITELQKILKIYGDLPLATKSRDGVNCEMGALGEVKRINAKNKIGSYLVFASGNQ
jgi:hypothetical protein